MKQHILSYTYLQGTVGDSPGIQHLPGDRDGLRLRRAFGPRVGVRIRPSAEHQGHRRPGDSWAGGYPGHGHPTAWQGARDGTTLGCAGAGSALSPQNQNPRRVFHPIMKTIYKIPAQIQYYILLQILLFNGWYFIVLFTIYVSWFFGGSWHHV